MKAARRIVFDSGRATVPNEALRFAYVGLCDPPKDVVRAVDEGEPEAAARLDRQVRMVLLEGPEADVVEVIVSVTRGEVLRWEVLEDVRPALQMEEAYAALIALYECPEWHAALDRRGITDHSLVQVDPWPAGTFGLEHEKGRRITKCIPYLRAAPDDNGYARPIEGLLAVVDMGRGEVLEVLDYGTVPIPPTSGSYYPENNGPLRTDLKPLQIIQPEGPSFEVQGNLVRWQKWSLRVGMDPLEGLVLSTIGYEDGGRVRPIVYRASVSEMVVPYGHPSPMHSWKSAFDAGEWGLGRMANSLTLGCDCLGEIHYFDYVFADERCKPHTKHNAICLHEEDYSILWKHVDMVSGRTEVRRSRRLVVSSIATVGNYEYGFYWYFYLDGTLQLEVKLTGIMSTMGVDGDEPGVHARLVAPGLAAPLHQHLFNVRLDVEIDGAAQRRLRGGRRADAARGGEPRRQCLRDDDHAARDGGGGAAGRRPVALAHVAHRQPQPAQPPGPADGLQARARSHADACWPLPNRASAAAPPSRRTTCGSPPSPPRSGGRRATTPTSTQAAPGCRRGRRATGPWSTPTSCCGIPSA